MQRKRHLVLVPCPFQGHITPILQLAKALHSKTCFSITIAHTIHDSPIGPHTHPDFAFLPLPDGLSDRRYSVADSVANVLTINAACLETLRRFLQVEAVSCVISDELMFAAEEAANSLDIPSVILRTTSAVTALARPAFVRLKEEGRLNVQGQNSHDIVPGLSPLRFKDLPLSPSPDFQKSLQLVSKAYGSRTLQAVIWNTAYCLEESILEKIQQQCQVPIFPIGPIHKLAPAISSALIEEDRSCISWLDKQPDKSVFYVSNFGSLASLGEEEVCEIAWGLAHSEQRFLWVIRPGSVQGSDWIELLPQGFLDAVEDRGCIVKWTPQKDVLAHSAVGGFWSHCGWNSTLESLAEGVPMLCWPCFGDQRVNARYLSHVWGVGLVLEELERGEIVKAIRRMILDDEGNEMRVRAKEFKEKFEVSTRKGGSSYESLNELVNLIMSY